MRTFIPLWLLASFFIFAQTPPPVSPHDDTNVIRSTTNEVLLDFVVRDKHDRLIRNLTAGEVEIYEDGVKQKLNAFRAVSGREQTESFATGDSAGIATARSVNPIREVNLVSIVFQRMSRDGREFAQNAALEFLNNELRGNTYVAVYSLDYRLNPLSRYTKDHDMLAAAIRRAAGGAYQEFGRDAQNVMNQVRTTVTGGQGGLTTTSSVDVFGAPARMTAETAYSDTAKLMGSMIQEIQLKSANADGTQAMSALLMLARYQATLPGRKTILLMSEGLPVPPDNGEMMRATISAANRANVSFYSVDVRGLRVQSASSLSLNGIRGITGGVAGGVQNRVQTDIRAASAQDDILSNSLHGNTQLNMGELANGTGGFLIADTNDIQKPMRRIMEDVRTHYEVAYTPASSSLDGRFRKIEVRVARSNLVVQTRSGYYAMPEIGNKPLMPFELLGLNAINASPAPHAVTFRAGMLRFRTGKGSTQYVVTFEVPVKNVTVIEDPVRKVGRVHVSFLGLIRDRNQQVIERVSRDLANEFPLDKIPALKNGNLIYTQALDLAPGRYTLECAALDRESNVAGVKKIAEVVLENDGLSVSDISLVRRIEPLSASPDVANPLEFSGGRVTPTLSLTAANTGTTDLFFVVYPPETQSKPEVYLQFWQDGKLLRQVRPELPAETPGQGIPVLASAALKTGQYEVRVIARQGNVFARNTTAIVVEP